MGSINMQGNIFLSIKQQEVNRRNNILRKTDSLLNCQAVANNSSICIILGVLYHSKHYIGRIQGSRGDQAGQGQTGEASSRKIFKEWDSPGKRRR